LFYP
jgi:tetratricopeptide (TPR) repeat protein